MLLWNERRTETTPFLREYEQLLLHYGTDYQEVRHESTTDNIDLFSSPPPFKSASSICSRISTIRSWKAACSRLRTPRMPGEPIV